LLEERKSENFCEQYSNHSLGGRNRGNLCLLVVAGTTQAIDGLCPGNARRIEKMFVAELAGTERFNRAYHCFNRVAWPVHFLHGFNFEFYFL
jgi:hypothetical protein